jgi:serine/threonine protein phosphatase PrpC
LKGILDLKHFFAMFLIKEIEEMELSEEDKFMVVASDGVWEYLSD